MTTNSKGVEAAKNILLLRAHELSAQELAEAAISAYLATTEPSKPVAEAVKGVDWLETCLDIIHEHKRAYAVQRDELKQRGKGNQHVYAGFVGVCDSISQAIHDARKSALSTPPQAEAQWDNLLRIRDEAAFLLDRLDDLTLDDDTDDLIRDWNGHVEPSIARLRAALSTALEAKP
jgi:hypothetical protein